MVGERYTEEYWRKRFWGDEPECVKRAIRQVYQAYPAECLPQGVSDPMYIMNVIAFELGIGDGQGHFTITDKEKRLCTTIS